MWQCNHCSYNNEDKELVSLHIINNHKDKLARNARTKPTHNDMKKGRKK